MNQALLLFILTIKLPPPASSPRDNFIDLIPRPCTALPEIHNAFKYKYIYFKMSYFPVVLSEVVKPGRACRARRLGLASEATLDE